MKIYIVFENSKMKVFESQYKATKYYEALKTVHPEALLRLEEHEVVQ